MTDRPGRAPRPGGRATAALVRVLLPPALVLTAAVIARTRADMAVSVRVLDSCTVGSAAPPACAAVAGARRTSSPATAPHEEHISEGNTVVAF